MLNIYSMYKPYTNKTPYMQKSLNDATNYQKQFNGSKNDNFRENYQNRYRETNQELIKYIYSTIDISQFKYDLLKYEHQLNKFLSDTYYVSPNYYGKNCFLVFTKLKSRYYSFMVDRRQLSYSLDKVQFDNVFIHHCNVDVDLPIYGGTIFDGIHIKKGNVNEFLITDVYYFKGTDYTDAKLNHKLFEIEMYLDNIGGQVKYNKEKIKSTKTNLELKINKLHDVTNIRKFIDSDLKKYQDTYQITGVSFYPELSGTKLIHLFDHNENTDKYIKNYTSKRVIDLCEKNTDSDEHSTHAPGPSPGSGPSTGPGPSTGCNLNSNHITKSNTNYNASYVDNSYKNNKTNNNDYDKQGIMIKSKKIVKNVYVAKTDDPFYAVLEMKPTKIADNYKLFAVEQIKVGDVIKLKKHQMDIAYIADMNKSIWCRDITTDSHKGNVFVKCVWRHDKRKWEPIELVHNVRLPTLMDDILKNLVEMEVSDSDSDSDC